MRAIVRCQDWQTFRLPWVPFFEIPWLPEAVLTTGPGRKFLRWAIIVREARKGAIDRPLVDELVARFQHPRDLAPPIDWYRAIVATHILLDGGAFIPCTTTASPRRSQWSGGCRTAPYRPKSLLGSGRDAKCEVEWRPLESVGHFVSLEAPDQLASEIIRALASAPN